MWLLAVVSQKLFPDSVSASDFVMSSVLSTGLWLHLPLLHSAFCRQVSLLRVLLRATEGGPALHFQIPPANVITAPAKLPYKVPAESPHPCMKTLRNSILANVETFTQKCVWHCGFVWICMYLHSSAGTVFTEHQWLLFNEYSLSLLLWFSSDSLYNFIMVIF